MAIDDGWIIWRGEGDPPIPDEATVIVKLRNGVTGPIRKDMWEWIHIDSHSDIIAYRIAHD